MKSVYLTFNYGKDYHNYEKIAIKCQSREELRDVLSDIFEYDDVRCFNVIDEGKPDESYKVIPSILYWEKAYEFNKSKI